MSELLNPIAEKGMPDSGEIMSPDEAYLVRDNNKFFCPDYNCKDIDRTLIVKKSSKDNCFFSHKPGCEHPIMPETLLHKSAVKWFADQTEYETPVDNYFSGDSMQILNKEKTELEFRQLERHIPDVVLTTIGDFQFAIEIFVTNDISREKAKILTDFGLPTIRVDLSDFYDANKLDCRVNLKFIQDNLDILMNDINRKNWVSFQKNETIKDTDNAKSLRNNSGCATIFFVLGITLLLLRL